jgi:hypothetical protein
MGQALSVLSDAEGEAFATACAALLDQAGTHS